MSTRDIAATVEEMDGAEVSHGLIAQVTQDWKQALNRFAIEFEDRLPQ